MIKVLATELPYYRFFRAQRSMALPLDYKYKLIWPLIMNEINLVLFCQKKKKEKKKEEL